MNSMDAWQAYDRTDYERAGQIWLQLIAETAPGDARLQYLLDYSYVLLAQDRYHDALTLLKTLYADTRNPVFLHQMGCVAREAGELEWARTYFLAEISKLGPLTYTALSANAYELGRVALLQKALGEALTYAQTSLKQALAAGNLVSAGSAHSLLGDVLCGLKQRVEGHHHYKAARLAFSSANRPPIG